MLVVDVLLRSVRNLEGAVNLEAQIYFCWVWIRLLIKAALSVEDLDVDVKCARLFVQLQEIALIGTDYKIPEEYADGDLEDQTKIRKDFAFDLQGGELAECCAHEAIQPRGAFFPSRHRIQHTSNEI